MICGRGTERQGLSRTISLLWPKAGVSVQPGSGKSLGTTDFSRKKGCCAPSGPVTQLELKTRNSDLPW
jgi:hypothetical protein